MSLFESIFNGGHGNKHEEPRSESSHEMMRLPLADSIHADLRNIEKGILYNDTYVRERRNDTLPGLSVSFNADEDTLVALLDNDLPYPLEVRTEKDRTFTGTVWIDESHISNAVEFLRLHNADITEDPRQAA